MDPQTESKGTTHIYVARAWYRDTATWFNIGSFVFLLLQESEFVKLIPVAWHPATTAFVIAFNLWIRFQSSTRPVALQEGTPVEVHSLPPKPSGSKGRVNLGKVGKPLVILALSGSLLAMTSCAKAPPSLTPVGTAAYHATQVVKALDVLRDAAIDAEAQTPKLISTDNTRKIVTFHEAAVKTIHASPGGWKPTVVAALDQLQHDILPAEWNRLMPYVSLVKALIEATS